jgi:DNA-binding MarR family transcriptional regulator
VPDDASRRAAAARVVDQLAQVARRSRAFGMSAARAYGLQPTQVELLVTVSRAGECRLASLAAQQLVDPSVISRQIGALERGGLLARRPDPEDGRAALVSVTDRGAARLTQVRALVVETVAESIQQWPADRAERLADDLEVLLDAIEDACARLAGAAPGAAPDAPPKAEREALA